MRIVALLAMLVACNSGYTPRRPGAIAVVIKDGKSAYVRDGATYDHGLLGGGLVDAVSGNPAATAAAHEYRSRLGTGLIGVLLTSACTVGALADAIAHGGSYTSAERDLWIAIGCTGVMMLSAAYAASAEPYRWDAINMFNDGYTGPPQWTLIPKRPAPTASLRMRD